MAVRLAVVCLLVLSVGCGSDDGGTFQTFPVPQWARGRADLLNSGFSPTGVTNNGGADCDSAGVTCAALGGGSIRTTPAIAVNGTVYVTTLDGAVVALTPDLVELWRVQVPESGGEILGTVRSSPAVDADNNVYFGTDEGWVVSLDGNAEGALLWATRVGDTAVVGSPLLVVDTFNNLTQAVFVGTSDGRVVALGGLNGQIRWSFETGGAVDGDLLFDGLTLYAPSASGFLYSLTQRGAQAFPRVSLGSLGSPFTASASLLGQTVAQSGLASTGEGGRVRGFATSGSAPIWEVPFEAPVPTSPGQFRHAVTQITGGQPTDILVVEYLVVDAGGTGWLLDPQLGSPGTRCMGGADDQRPCFSAEDCEQGEGEVATCEPLHQCAGGEMSGSLCRRDTGAEDCGEGVACEPITKCDIGPRVGTPCNDDAECGEGGRCNFSLFSVSAPVLAPPTTSADATILVATAPESGEAGTLYAIEPPGLSEPSVSTCPPAESTPAFCRFAFRNAFGGGAIRAAPSLNQQGWIYFGDDSGILYVIRGS